MDVEPEPYGNIIERMLRFVDKFALYMSVSISMMFINGALLGGKKLGNKDAPLFVTCFQCFVTAIACHVVSSINQCCPETKVPQLEPSKIKRVLPLTINFMLMIAANNFTLKFLGIAFYNIGRSLAIVFTSILTYFILGQKTSPLVILTLCVVVSGFFMGVNEENASGSLSVVGAVLGIMSSAIAALYSIVIKKVLPVVDNSVFILSYYNNVLATVMFIPAILLTGEGPAVYEMITNGTLHFWVLMTCSGLFGFAIGYVSTLQVKVTSPLTHNISGTSKNCVQTVMATTFFNESKSGLWWVSNLLVLTGSACYTLAKQRELRQGHALEQQQQKHQHQQGQQQRSHLSLHVSPTYSNFALVDDKIVGSSPINMDLSPSYPKFVLGSTPSTPTVN
ncbi:unnamed protein product, partial [Meganyctiphanes norvegica]